MTKLLSYFPLPLPGDQTCCEKTPFRQEEGIKCSTPFCESRWLCLVMDLPEYARLIKAHAKNLWQAIKRKRLGIFSNGMTMPARRGHSRLGTWCEIRFGNVGARPHIVQIWDPRIITFLPPDRTLLRKSFHPHFWWCQTCYRHVVEARVLCVGMDKLSHVVIESQTSRWLCRKMVCQGDPQLWIVNFFYCNFANGLWVL